MENKIKKGERREATGHSIGGNFTRGGHHPKALYVLYVPLIVMRYASISSDLMA